MDYHMIREETDQEKRVKKAREMVRKKNKIKHVEGDDSQELESLALLFTAQYKDIFDAFIAPKLNPRLEVKFLYPVCRATRAAIKRAKIKLRKWKWKVSEFTSIATLEYAYDRKSKEMKQGEFCQRIAETNDLALLRWAREVKRCGWNAKTVMQAAYRGNLDMVKYCVEHGCPMNGTVCLDAVRSGRLDILKYVREHNCPWDRRTMYESYRRKMRSPDIFTYCIQYKAPSWMQYVNQ
jgi:hypothetical protein